MRCDAQPHFSERLAEISEQQEEETAAIKTHHKKLCKALGMPPLGCDARRPDPHPPIDELHPAEALDELLLIWAERVERFGQ